MPLPKVPLTRSTLLTTQRALSFAREGYELLDRKREVLLAELMANVEGAERAQEDLEAGLGDAYQTLARARMAVGVDGVQRAALAIPAALDLKIVERSIMGAVVPNVECAPVAVRPSYSFTDTTAALDQARIAFAGLAERLCRVAESRATVLRLAREINKTQRRVNALRNVVIPQQEAIIKAVQEALEEAERESFFRAKMFKRRMGGEGR
jgi:V/A-type H+-transporting ATPase subunit D